MIEHVEYAGHPKYFGRKVTWDGLNDLEVSWFVHETDPQAKAEYGGLGCMRISTSKNPYLTIKVGDTLFTRDDEFGIIGFIVVLDKDERQWISKKISSAEQAVKDAEKALEEAKKNLERERYSSHNIEKLRAIKNHFDEIISLAGSLDKGFVPGENFVQDMEYYRSRVEGICGKI